MKRGFLKIILLIVLLAGLAGWIFSYAEDSPRALISLLVNFTFFVPLAAGLVVWPAAVIASNGNWMGGTERVAKTAVVFSVPSIIILIVLWITSHNWAPWVKDNGDHGMWLNNTFLFIRDLVLLILFWAAAVVFIRKRAMGQGKLWAGILSFTYCIVFTFLGYDLVMALEPSWRSNLFGAYFFISGLYIAITGWTLLSILYKNFDKSKIMDMGKLIVTFCLMTTYMMYSQLLPFWYENIPEETKYIVPRTNFFPWAVISLIISVIVYFSPLVLLLTRWSKRTPWVIGLVSFIVLSGLWIERWWLVSVKFNPAGSFGLPEIVTLLLFLGLFGLSYDWFYSSKYLRDLEKAGNG